MRQQLLETARAYTGDGISITLTDDRKVSIGSWKEFQTRFITEDELQERVPLAKGIAIICGAISGNIEVIDIDLKYDVTGTLFKRLQEAIPEHIADKLVISRTISKGFHLYYRCASLSGNTKLARRPATDEELKANPHAKVFVLIETRGEGGYVIAPPTPGYKWTDGTQSSIQHLTDEEREELFTICRSFNEYVEEPSVSTPMLSGSTPLDEYNQRGDVVGLLVKHGWTMVRKTAERTYLRRPGKTEGTSGDWLHDKRWFSVFTTSSQFEPNKAYNAATIYCMLECNGDWKETVRQLSSQGFGNDVAGKKKRFETMDRWVKDGLTLEQRKNRFKEVYPQASISEVKEHENQPPPPDGIFWSTDRNERIIISKPKLIDFIHSQGYRLMPFDLDQNKLQLVKVVNNRVSMASIEKVKKDVYAHVKRIAGDNAEAVSSAILDKYKLFNGDFLEFLERAVPSFVTDTKDAAHFFFQNGVVQITKEQMQFLNYGELPQDKLIWESAIINHDITLDLPEGFDFTYNWTGPVIDVFPKFLYFISGQDQTRFLAVCSHIGYLLHKFKDKTIPVAVILAEETDNDAKGGGTGKGIFCQALSKLCRTETIDGKNFKIDKNFAFQRISPDTNIIVLQDVLSTFNLEALYSILTEGITIERKNQPEIYLPFEVSPKMLITTNYAISDYGNHAARRQRVIPFSDYFSPSHTPMDEFNQVLFDDWDLPQWNAFYNFMFACVAAYLKTSIITIHQSDSMRYKAIKTTFGNEFKDWFKEFISANHEDFQPFADIYQSFLSHHGMTEQEYSRKRFRSAVQKACETFGLKLQSSNKGKMGGVNWKIVNS